MARVHFAWRVTRSELWHNALWLVHCLPNNPLIGCKNWTFKSSLTIKRFLDRAECYDKHGTLHCKDQLSICFCIDARNTEDIVWWHWLWRIPRSQSPVMTVLVLDNGSCDIQHSGWVIRHLQRVYHVYGIQTNVGSMRCVSVPQCHIDISPEWEKGLHFTFT